MTKPLNKLDYLQIGPFKILEIKGLIIFKLDLLKRLRIYLIFYISLFEKVLKNVKIIILEVKEDKIEYKVERIVAYSETRD
jgi:hypothetical protein